VPKLHRSPGFSLLELLIVMLIIAVLTALLIPTVSRVRESATITKCGSNLRQIGQALHAYRADHKAFPVALTMPPPFKLPLDTGEPIYATCSTRTSRPAARSTDVPATCHRSTPAAPPRRR
jgi:prepilin-type N-terminal cleavage/methylation domain-containing protein